MFGNILGCHNWQGEVLLAATEKRGWGFCPGQCLKTRNDSTPYMKSAKFEKYNICISVHRRDIFCKLDGKLGVLLGFFKAPVCHPD
jgi:hypothetical protein